MQSRTINLEKTHTQTLDINELRLTIIYYYNEDSPFYPTVHWIIINQIEKSMSLKKGIAKKLSIEIQGVHKILCFFPRILESLPLLPHQYLAANWLYKKLPANRSDCTLALH